MTASTVTVTTKQAGAAPQAVPDVVDGLRVVENVPAISPLSKPHKPVYFQQIRELLLEDGSARFRCVHCPETSDRLGKIRRHLSTHADPTTTTMAKATGEGGRSRTGKKAKGKSAQTRAAGALPPAAQESESSTSVITDNALSTLTLADITARLHELQELDSLRAKVAKLTAECEQLRSERDDYRAGHDELLTATRGLTGYRERADDAENALQALHTVLVKTVPIVQQIFDRYERAHG